MSRSLRGTHSSEAAARDEDAAAVQQVAIALRHATLARGRPDGVDRTWVACALSAYRALDARDPKIVAQGMALINESTAAIVASIQKRYLVEWPRDEIVLGDTRIGMELLKMPASLIHPMHVRIASDVPMTALGGTRNTRAGLGVPLAVISGMPAVAAKGSEPYSGRFHDLTAWLAPGTQEGGPSARLVLANSRLVDAVPVGGRPIPLAGDTSAGYAWAMQRSNLERSGLWALVGGKAVARRAGLYMLEDYDPGKRPLVMIHGLGSQPLIWSHLSNTIWGDEDLRSRFQIWQVLHETDAPVLATRQRVEHYLDTLWNEIEGLGRARASSRTVLIGHSLGGVIARLLCSVSGDALWNAAFLKPLDALETSDADRQVLSRIFFFHPYPGVERGMYLAAPHKGSPAAAGMAGRLLSELIGGRAAEMQVLRRVALSNPDALHPALRESFTRGHLNSIGTLQPEHPMRRAVESIMPEAHIPYHVVAGVLPNRRMPSDGVVPLDSALLPGASSSLIVGSGHRLLGNRLVIDEILRILRLG